MSTLPPLSPRAWLRHDLIARRLAEVPRGAAVLEVGPGQGAMAVRLAHRFRWTGVEADTTSAAVARRRLEDEGVAHTLHATMVEEAPLEPPYDAVVAFEVLEHIEDDRGALELWRSLLAPGGLLVLSVPAWSHRMGPADDFAGHFRRYDPPDLAALLRDTGFADVATELYGFPLDYGLEAVRNAVAAREPAPDDAADGTARSGRWLQVDDPRVGTVTQVLSAPFRRLQDLVDSDRLGTGIVASARRPV